jgi:hypothetical protein
MENRVFPIHRWVPWIAGFSGQFVQDVFKEFLVSRTGGRRPCVLDPFAGVGSTLVEALLHRFDSVGFEINPWAALVSRAKVSAPLIKIDRFDAFTDSVKGLSKGFAEAPLSSKPAGFRSKIPFFSQRVERQVLTLLDEIDRIDDPGVRSLAKISLGAILVSVSNYSYEPSLSSRPASGKPLIEDADVLELFLRKLRDVRSDVLWMKGFLGKEGVEISSKVHTDSFFSSRKVLDSGSIALMVTSPPYLNNYHYVRNTRPQLFWLSLISESSELRRLEEENFGKFWQTVRDAAPIDLLFEHKGLESTLADLRRIRTDSGAYGGPGWANYVASYFNDCFRFVNVLKPALRREGVGVVVIGNSVIQGVEVKTDRILGEIAVQCGFRLHSIVELRTKRVGSSITFSSVRRGKRSSTRLYESAVILKK